jgi:hypothetical protein
MEFQWRPVLGILLFLLLLTFVILMALGVIPLNFSTTYTTNVYETEPTSKWYWYSGLRAKDASGNPITFY